MTDDNQRETPEQRAARLDAWLDRLRRLDPGPGFVVPQLDPGASARLSGAGAAPPGSRR